MRSHSRSASKLSGSKAKAKEFDVESEVSEETKKALEALDDPRALDKMLYIDNAEGDPDKYNAGYQVGPLNPKIYSKKKIQA